jgi:hypothetical protein
MKTPEKKPPPKERNIFGRVPAHAPVKPSDRFEVLHPRLGRWERGAVLTAGEDLAGADIHALLEMGAVVTTDKPRDVKVREEEEPKDEPRSPASPMEA